jgi:hypothetical protein
MKLYPTQFLTQKTLTVASYFAAGILASNTLLAFASEIKVSLKEVGDLAKSVGVESACSVTIDFQERTYGTPSPLYQFLTFSLDNSGRRYFQFNAVLKNDAVSFSECSGNKNDGYICIAEDVSQPDSDLLPWLTVTRKSRFEFKPTVSGFTLNAFEDSKRTLRGGGETKWKREEELNCQR